MTDAAARTAPDPDVSRTGWLPAALAAGLLLAVKIYAGLTINPIGDEAYYWLWGQKPALSYFDHPPLHAWMLGLVDALLGWNLFSLRALTWVTFLGTLAIFWDWARRLAPAAPADYFWRATAIYLASPLFLGMSSIAFNDHLMIFLCLASAHYMLHFAGDWESGRRRWPLLYLSALLLGLAVLTKYNAVFLGLGYAAWFILRPSLRSLLWQPHTYLAGLLSIAIQLPVFVWNSGAGFASYRFHLLERWTGPLQLRWEAPLLFILVALIVVSPFLMIGVVRFFRRSPAPGFAARAAQLAIVVFVISSLAMLVLASFAEVFFYWNIVAFLLLVPLVVEALGRRWLFWLHMGYGTAMALLLVFNQTVAPIGNVFGSHDWTISSTYGWEEIGAAVEAERRAHPDAFVATTFYTTAAQLGWYTRNPDVTAISPRSDQFDLWFDAAGHRGRSAIIVADAHYTIAHAETRFERVTLLRELAIMSHSWVIYRPKIYLAEGFIAPPGQ